MPSADFNQLSGCTPLQQFLFSFFITVAARYQRGAALVQHEAAMGDELSPQRLFIVIFEVLYCSHVPAGVQPSRPSPVRLGKAIRYFHRVGHGSYWWIK